METWGSSEVGLLMFLTQDRKCVCLCGCVFQNLFEEVVKVVNPTLKVLAVSNQISDGEWEMEGGVDPNTGEVR